MFDRRSAPAVKNSGPARCSDALPRLLGALLGAAYVAVIITPFCGWAFGCGCDWPWLGLADHCSIHNPLAVNPCPWCLHTMFGGGSAVGAAGVAAWAGYRWRSPGHFLRPLAGSLLLPLGFLSLWASITVVAFR